MTSTVDSTDEFQKNNPAVVRIDNGSKSIFHWRNNESNLFKQIKMQTNVSLKVF